MRKDDFLLAEYNALRQESRHNDQLRYQMIRFFIGLVLAVLVFLKFEPSPKYELWSSKPSFQAALLIAVALVGWCVLVFHALERAKNKENNYLFDWIRHHFWSSGEANGFQSEHSGADYELPKDKPVKMKTFWAWGTDLVYAVVISVINTFLVGAALYIFHDSAWSFILALLISIPLYWLGYVAVLRRKSGSSWIRSILPISLATHQVKTKNHNERGSHPRGREKHSGS